MKHEWCQWCNDRPAMFWGFCSTRCEKKYYTEITGVDDIQRG